MAKVTSKLQVTIPKRRAPAQQLDNDDPATIELRLRMFDASVERQKKRQRSKRKQSPLRDRGWKREDLYDRGRTR